MCYIHMSGEEQASQGCELTAEEWLEVGRRAVDILSMTRHSVQAVVKTDLCMSAGRN